MSRAFTAGNEFHTVGFVDTRTPPAPEARGHLSDFASVLHESRAEAGGVAAPLSDGALRGGGARRGPPPGPALRGGGGEGAPRGMPGDLQGGGARDWGSGAQAGDHLAS